MFDALKGLGGMGGMLGGLGDFEKIGKGIVDFQNTLDARTAAILENQRTIMCALGVGEKFNPGIVKEEVIENAG